MKVLIVDDSAMMRTVIRRSIEENGVGRAIEIVTGSNGEEALNLLEEHDDVGLVLIDWNMPVLDGVDFVRRVRGQGNDVPILMISAVTDQEKIYEAAAAGVTGYVEKPVKGLELWQHIAEYIR